MVRICLVRLEPWGESNIATGTCELWYKSDNIFDFFYPRVFSLVYNFKNVLGKLINYDSHLDSSSWGTERKNLTYVDYPSGFILICINESVDLSSDV